MKVLYEDNHLIAVHKPTGVLAQGDSTGDKSIMDEVKQYIKNKYKKPGDVFLGCIHRIDRVTSGVIVFARTSKALTRMNQLIKDRKIQKEYYAILEERPDQPAAKLVHYLRKNHKANYVVATLDQRPETKKAVLSYELMAEMDSRYLVRVDLETGRPHQIRSQFSSIGCSILGDTKYGGTKDNAYKNGIYLHAHEVSFVHPVKKEPLRITSTPDNRAAWKQFKSFI